MNKMHLEEARQLILVEHLKEDVALIAQELEVGMKDDHTKRIFKSLIRLIQYYSKYPDFVEYRKTLDHIPKKYFPK